MCLWVTTEHIACNAAVTLDSANTLVAAILHPRCPLHQCGTNSTITR
jgi:hypothetical protein